MGLFVTSTTAATLHGVYGILRTPPNVVVPQNTAIAAIVDAFLWGPSSSLGAYTPSDVNDRIQTFAPFGSSHTTGAYLATIQKAFPFLKVARVQPAAAAVASVTLASSTPTNLVTFFGKFAGGTIGNSIVCVVGPASNGVATAVDISFQISGPSGTTTDVLKNFDISSGGATVVAALNFSKARLVGSATWLANGTLAQGTYTFTGGADGTPTSGDFVGTQGTGDKGLAATEADLSIAHIFYGDPGNSIRAACNSGFVSHLNFVSSRMGYMTGNSGQTLSQAQTDVGNYRSYWARYFDPWVQIRDDLTGLTWTVPGASFGAAAASQLSPSTAISWKNPECTQFYAGVVGLEATRGMGAATNTANGICTFITEPTGGVSVEADVVTNAPADPANPQGTRSQMAIYITKSWMAGARPSVDSPNVPYNQQPLIDSLQTFLQGLKDNKDIDPNHKPYLVDFGIDNVSSFNASADVQGGQFTVPATAITGAEMSKIFLSLNIGTSVLKANLNP